MKICENFSAEINGNVTWTQSYDFLIYSYNASVVVAYSVFQSRKNTFCFQNALGYPWHCKNLQRWRCNSRS
jgi:hypothetical protein